MDEIQSLLQGFVIALSFKNVGLMLIGWGVVRIADPVHADFAVPAQASTPWT